jgi:RHS repeat-associated protein
VGGQSFALNYNAENRLVSVTGAATANFTYDGDGKQIKATVNGITAVYVGNHYEVKNSVVTKYYFAGTTRLAVRTDGTLSYLLSDHLGSSSVTTDANGAKTASALYKAFGETRYTLGTLGTDYKFTGQREEASLGIYFFVARWFDHSLGRFLSPDTIVPTSTQGTQAWDRYAFVNNNPVRYNDPTGHFAFLLPMLVGGIVGGAISVVTTYATAKAFGREPTHAELMGAAAGGFVGGAISVIAMPLAGSALGLVGVKAAGVALKVGATAVNAAGGAASYYAAGATENAVNVSEGNEPTFEPTATGLLLSMGTSALTTGKPGVPRTLKQTVFMPGRTVNSMFSPKAVRADYQVVGETFLGYIIGGAEDEIAPYTEPFFDAIGQTFSDDEMEAQ